MRFEGWSIHLPMGTGGTAANVRRGRPSWAGPHGRIRPGTLWVSHVPAAGLARSATDVRLRMGTALWLGDRARARRAGDRAGRCTTYDRGERVGYRQRRCPADGHLLVVSGGTSHGIGLEAPTARGERREQRAVSLAKGGLDAAGLALSPFTVGGKQRWFVEPPHMQASMLFLPSSVKPPAVGDEIGVDVRFTTTTFDRIEFT